MDESTIVDLLREWESLYHQLENNCGDCLTDRQIKMIVGVLDKYFDGMLFI